MRYGENISYNIQNRRDAGLIFQDARWYLYDNEKEISALRAYIKVGGSYKEIGTVAEYIDQLESVSYILRAQHSFDEALLHIEKGDFTKALLYLDVVEDCLRKGGGSYADIDETSKSFAKLRRQAA